MCCPEKASERERERERERKREGYIIKHEFSITPKAFLKKIQRER